MATFRLIELAEHIGGTLKGNADLAIGSQIIAVWLETTVLNFPMAFCWQLFFAGPFVRFLFRNIFREKEAENENVYAADAQ